MRVTWYIERHGFGDDSPKNVANIVRTLGHKVVETVYVPTSNDISEIEYSKGIKVEDGEPVISFTSINLARILKIKKPQWFPCLWADFDKLKCQSYYSNWGKYILQSNYAFIPLAEIIRRKEWVYKIFGNKDNQVFIRPDDNVKSFSGEVVHIDSFDRFIKNANFYGDNLSTLSVVSEPINILQEYRFIIADNKVLTGSLYRNNKHIEYNSKYDNFAAEFAEEVAKEYSPHRIYIMDIAKIENGYKLVEIGSVNMAGLYACDLLKFVSKASEIAIEEYREAYQ